MKLKLALSCLVFTGLIAASAVTGQQKKAGEGTAEKKAEATKAAMEKPGAKTNPAPLPDATEDAQTPRVVPVTRPEQTKTEADAPKKFMPESVPPVNAAVKDQPKGGKITGFDFYRDPLNADKPMQTLAEIMEADKKARPEVGAAQRKLLETRYDLKPKFHPDSKMTRGKPVPMGPTARLKEGVTWDSLGSQTPDAIKSAGSFPYPALPHPKQVAGGQVFPEVQLQMFPRLRRYDVDFDIPDAFIPEFPPAIFLQNRPELGDVSRGEVVSINNYYALFKDVVTPVQLDGLRLLLTPMPQEEFNPTDDRKSELPSLGVTCFDCHVNGHTTGQFHLNPDDRPQERRMRLDTVSLRGMFNQQVHGSKRSLRSVEDFTEFEQRTAYFNGDQIHAFKKGAVILDRVQVSHMAQFQNMLDFPPAPKLDPITGRLDRSKASESEVRGEELFFGKAQCASCHDLKTERFVDEAPLGPIKSFTLRGIKESPPYMHDGRCLTLEDTVEFFNLVMQLKLAEQEKKDLSDFLRAL
jgi:cytochrome c peroxidase